MLNNAAWKLSLFVNFFSCSSCSTLMIMVSVKDGHLSCKSYVLIDFPFADATRNKILVITEKF